MFKDFLAFNTNAFFEISYFIAKNIFILLGIAGIGYLFYQENVLEHANDVKDDREIL